MGEKLNSELVRLAEHQARLEAIVASVQDAIVTVNAAERITLFNAAAEKMFGFTAEQMLGEPLSRLIPDRFHATHSEHMQRFAATGVSQRAMVGHGTQWARRATGEEFPIEASISQVEINGERYFTAIVRDVTERLQAEAALRESQQFLEEAQETAKIGSWSLDMATGQITWSRQSMKVFGVSPDSDSLALADAMRVVHPDDRAATQAVSERAFSEGHPFSVEFRVQLADGELRWVRASGQPVRDEAGRVTGFRGINQDITAHVQAEQERLKLEQQFLQAQKMEAIGTLAGGIAHDFNNILGAIQGYGELVLEHLEPGSQDYLDQQEVLQAAERAGQLVRQILTFSRKTQTKRVLVSLPLIVKEVSKLMRATLPTTIEVRQNLEVSEALVTADPIEVHQILVNLCTNAGHAMPDGGVLEISLRSHSVDGGGTFGLHAAELATGHYYMLGVTDTGAGIPPDIIGRIFEPFFTTKEQGEGTGLGLSTVHGTVKSLGGTVTVYSELGEGTTFHVYLPATEGRHSEDAKREVHHGSERILLVDDEPALAKLGKNVLEGLGYYVHAETDSITALSIFQNAPDQFDLLITDETMPKLKGSELAKFVAELRPELPVLLCTGYGQEVPGAVPSIKAVLHKPVSRAELSLAIREALPGSKLIGQG